MTPTILTSNNETWCLVEVPITAEDFSVDWYEDDNCFELLYYRGYTNDWESKPLPPGEWQYICTSDAAVAEVVHEMFPIREGGATIGGGAIIPIYANNHIEWLNYNLASHSLTGRMAILKRVK